MNTLPGPFRCGSAGITRGIALRAGILALTLAMMAAAASRFWDAKPPSQWTPDEVLQLIGNSPWAKRVTAQYRVALEGHGPRPDSAPQVGGRGEGRGGECGIVPCGSIMPGSLVVIWESAQPIREALRPVIPPDFNGHYVISIRGLEIELTEEQLLRGATLSAKGNTPIHADLARRRANTWVLGFSRELMPLTPDDKDVQFMVRMGANLSNTLLRADFNPKDMVYRGSLAM